MKISTAYIDMDGVLTDFVAGALEVHKAPHWYEQYPANVWAMYNFLGVTEIEFWRVIDQTPDYWESLKPYQYVADLLDCLVDHFGIANLAIATSPHQHAACYAGKWNWFAKHILPKWPIKTYIPIVGKSQLAKPGRLLIDDSDHNLAEWEKEGGTGFLWPQPWNSGHKSRLDESGNSKWLHQSIGRDLMYDDLRARFERN